MASFVSNFDSILGASVDSNRKRRRKIEGLAPEQNLTSNSKTRIRWRSDSEQRIYSSKLIQALYQVRTTTSSPSEKVPGSRRVRDTADRVLATAAKGTTRWSRAILANRLRMSRNLHKKNHRKAKVVPRPSRLQKTECRRLAPTQKKVRVLGRLVPGCRKVSFPNLLEEAGDYIAALEMQVRAMTALTELLTGTPNSSMNPSS